MAYVSAQLKACGATLRGDEQTWVYDTDDAAAVVAAAGYINDALKKGVRVGHCITVRQWANVDQRMNPPSDPNPGNITAVTMHTVTLVDIGTNTDGDATLTAGTTI